MAELELLLNLQDIRGLYLFGAFSITVFVMWRLFKPLSRSFRSSWSAKKGDRAQQYLSQAALLGAGILIGICLANFHSSRPLQEVRDESVKTQFTLCEPKEDKYQRPRGAENLPPKIIQATTDLHERRLWGKPEEDLPSRSKYLLALTVGERNREHVEKIVGKFTNQWTVILFHYDNKVDDWNDSAWSAKAVHVAAKKQSKWWFAKRFLHPDIVEAYSYIFVWDEDIDVSHFDPVRYLDIVKKRQFEISQPALVGTEGVTWKMTLRREDVEAHTFTDKEPAGWCKKGPNFPPCAGFVEISAPVFSRGAWRCVWHMIQNDLIHGWGIDFNLHRCTKGPAHESIGVINTEYISHIPNLPSVEDKLDEDEEGETPWESIDARAKYEWSLFTTRMEEADKAIQPKKEVSEGKVILSR